MQGALVLLHQLNQFQVLHEITCKRKVLEEDAMEEKKKRSVDGLHELQFFEKNYLERLSKMWWTTQYFFSFF